MVHFVNSDDEVSDSQSKGQKSVLSGLSFGRNSGLELGWSGGDDQNGYIGLRSTGNHVFDEISVSWSIDDGAVVFFGLEFVQGDVDGDSSLSLGLEFIQNPSVGERSLSHFCGFFSEFLDGSLGNSSALTDQVTGGGTLSRVDMSNDYDV